jgi:hypothetical protein
MGSDPNDSQNTSQCQYFGMAIRDHSPNSPIDCTRKAITVTNSDGVQIEHIATMPSRKAYYKKPFSGPTLDQVPVVCEYPDVFPEKLPGMPLTGISSS